MKILRISTFNEKNDANYWNSGLKDKQLFDWKMSKRETRVEHIADIVGEWGVWQLIVFCFVFCLWIITALNNMGYTFYAYEEEFWCSDVPNDYPVIIVMTFKHTLYCYQKWHYFTFSTTIFKTIFQRLSIKRVFTEKWFLFLRTE